VSSIPEEAPSIPPATLNLSKTKLKDEKSNEIDNFRMQLNDVETSLVNMLNSDRGSKEFAAAQNRIINNLPISDPEPGKRVQKPGEKSESRDSAILNFNRALEQISNIRPVRMKKSRKLDKDQINQDLGDAFYYLGLIYENRYSDITGAINAYGQVIKFYPDNVNAPQAQYQIGVLYYNTGNYLKSYNAFKKLCAKYPENLKCAEAEIKAKTARDKAAGQR